MAGKKRSPETVQSYENPLKYLSIKDFIEKFIFGSVCCKKPAKRMNGLLVRQLFQKLVLIPPRNFYLRVIRHDHITAFSFNVFLYVFQINKVGAVHAEEVIIGKHLLILAKRA